MSSVPGLVTLSRRSGPVETPNQQLRPTASAGNRLKIVKPDVKSLRLIAPPSQAPTHVLTRPVDHVVTVAPHADLEQIFEDTATYLRGREGKSTSRLVLNLQSQTLPDPESDDWQEFKKDLQVLGDGHGVTICVKSNQLGEEGGLEIQPYTLMQETLRKPAMAAMPSMTLSLRHEQRLEQKLEHSLQLALQEPYSGMCQIYAEAAKKTYAKHGMQFEYASVKRSDVPYIVAFGSAGMCWGDMIFVVEDYFPDSDPEFIRPGFREQFNELVAVHEFGERLWHNHHQASMLEFSVAQDEGILEEYLGFLKGRYLLKFRDVVFERMLPELRENLGLREDINLHADDSEIDADDPCRRIAEKYRDGFSWPDDLYQTYATELHEYDLSNEELEKSEKWANAVRTQALAERCLDDAGKELLKSFEKAFGKSGDVVVSFTTATAAFYRKLDGLLTAIDENEDKFKQEFLSDEILAATIERVQRNLEVSLVRAAGEKHKETVAGLSIVKRTWSEHAAILKAQRDYLSYLKDEREIDDVVGDKAKEAMKKLWAKTVIPCLVSGKYANELVAIEDQYVVHVRNKLLKGSFDEIASYGTRKFYNVLHNLRDYPLAMAYLERYILFNVAEMCRMDELRQVTAADVQPLVDEMLAIIDGSLKRARAYDALTTPRTLPPDLPEKLDPIDVSKMTADGKNLADYYTPENDVPLWLARKIFDRARRVMSFDDADPLNSGKYSPEDAVIALSELFVSYFERTKSDLLRIDEGYDPDGMQHILNDWLEEQLTGHPEHAALARGPSAFLFDLEYYFGASRTAEASLGDVITTYQRLVRLHLGRENREPPKRPDIFMIGRGYWLADVARAAQNEKEEAARITARQAVEHSQSELAKPPLQKISDEELENEIDKLGTLTTFDKKGLLQQVIFAKGPNDAPLPWKRELLGHYSKIIETIFPGGGVKTNYLGKTAWEIYLELAAQLIPFISKFGQFQPKLYRLMPKDAVEYLMRTDSQNASILYWRGGYAPKRFPQSVGARVMNSFDRKRGERQKFFDQDPIAQKDIDAAKNWAAAVDKILRAFLKVNEANRGTNYHKYVEQLTIMAVLAAKDRGHKFNSWGDINYFLEEAYPGIPRLKP